MNEDILLSITNYKLPNGISCINWTFLIFSSIDNLSMNIVLNDQQSKLF